MQIYSTGINSKNYNLNTFKSKMYEIQKMQNIKGLKCACCGRDLIIPNDIAHTFAETTRPLAEIMKKGYLDEWRNFPAMWNKLYTFKKDFPQASFDTIVQNNQERFSDIRGILSTDILRQMPEIDYVQKNMISKRVYKNLLASTRKELFPAKTVMERFSIYKKYLDGEPLKAFEALQEYAQKYPNKRLSEIINLNEVYNYHFYKNKATYKKNLENLNICELNILKIINSEQPLLLPYFKDAGKNINKILFEQRYDKASKIYHIRNLFKTRLEGAGCSDLMIPIMEEIEKIPEFSATADYFLVKANDENYSDADIIRNILAPFTASFEHIIPRANMGSNSIYNGLVMCAGCNRSRGRKKYSEILNAHPEMLKNIQNQIDYISNYILTGQIKDESISRWPIAVSLVLKKYTNGAISPDATEYVPKIINFMENKYNNSLKEIDNLKQQLAEYKKIKTTSDDEQIKINMKIGKIMQQITILENENNDRFFDLKYLKKIESGEIQTAPDVKWLENH